MEFKKAKEERTRRRREEKVARESANKRMDLKRGEREAAIRIFPRKQTRKLNKNGK